MEYTNEKAKRKQWEDVSQMNKELEDLKKNHLISQDEKIQRYQLLKAKLDKQSKIATLETQLTNSIRKIQKSISGEIVPTGEIEVKLEID